MSTAIAQNTAELEALLEQARNLPNASGSGGGGGGSITHYWDGTTLVVTSDSGTSSADLEGPKGEKGVSVVKATLERTDIADDIVSASITLI